MKITDEQFERIKETINTTIHELVMACQHCENDEIDSACDCLVTCQSNLDAVANQLVAHDSSAAPADATPEPASPWRTSDDPPMAVLDAEGRIARVKSSDDIAWLKSVLAWPHNQKAVTRAAQARLNRLAKR